MITGKMEMNQFNGIDQVWHLKLRIAEGMVLCGLCEMTITTER